MAFLDRLFGWSPRDLGTPLAAPLRGPAGRGAAVQALSLNDPLLIEFMRGGPATATGVTVTPKLALRNSTMFRALGLISGAMGMLPIHLMRRTGDDTREKARDHPLYTVLHKRPNGYQTASEFKAFMQLACLLDGNAYALIVRSRGGIRALLPLPRGSTEPKLDDDGTLWFEHRPRTGAKRRLAAEDVFHFRHPMSLDGLKGVSLLEIAAETLGLGVKAQRAAARGLSKGVMAGGAISHPGTLGDEAYARLKESILGEAAGGAEAAGDWMLLEEDMKAQPFAATAKDAMLLETRKFEAEEVARFTDVPRPLLMFDETSWGSGIEQLSLLFVIYCLLKWFGVWEDAIFRMLTPAEQDEFYAKYNAAALLRGSTKEQGEFFARALGSGGGAPWMTQNEVRAAFDQNAVAGGDVLPARSAAPAADPFKEPKPDA